MIDSPALAEQYTDPFHERISSDHEHKHVKGRSGMGQPMRPGEATITPGFPPAGGEDIEHAIISLLNGA